MFKTDTERVLTISLTLIVIMYTVLLIRMSGISRQSGYSEGVCDTHGATLVADTLCIRGDSVVARMTRG